MAGFGAIGVYFLVPAAAQGFIYNAFGMGVVAAILVGVRVHRPERRLQWYLLALGQFALFLGDVLFRHHAWLFGTVAPYPSLADVVYVASYPLLISALLVQIRLRAPGRDKSSLLDAMVVTVGAGLLAWVFVVEPYTEDLSMPLFERFFSVVYPLLALMTFAVLVRLVTTFRERVPSYRLLALGVFSFVLSDIVYGALEVAGSYRIGSVVDAGWLLSYVLLGCAALHPSMRTLSEGAAGSATRTLTWRRLILLAAASLVAPALLLFEELRGEQADVGLIAGASAVLFLLVLFRMEGLLRRLKEASERYERSAARERALGRVGAEFMVALSREDVYRVALRAVMELSGGASGTRASIMVGPLENLIVAASMGEGAGEAEGARVDSRKVPSIGLSYGERRVVEARRPDVEDVRGGLSFEPKRGDVIVGPLLVQGEPEGVISAATDGAFPEDFVDGFRALASQVSLALEGVTIAERTYRRKGEERFRSLIQNSSDMITVVDARGYVLYQSPSFGRVLGHENRMGVNIFSSPIVHPEDDESQRSFVEAAISNPGTSVAGEVRLRHRDGSWRHVEATFTSLLDDPNVAGVVLNARDVTERRRAEKGLREAEARFRALVEQAPAVVYVSSLDGAGAPIYVSPRATDLWGCTDEEWRAEEGGLPARAHPADRGWVSEEISRANEGSAPLSLEYRMVATGGGVVWVQDDSVVVRDAGGTPLHRQGFLLDITARKRGEEELREAYQRLGSHFENSPVGIVEWDREFKIIGWSREAERIFGWGAHEAVGRAVGELGFVYEEDRETVREAVSSRLLGGEERRVVLRNRNRKKDGTVVHCQWYNSALLDEAGGIVSVMSLALDVTESVEAEKALKESERRFRQLFEQSVDALLLNDETGRVVDCNAEACRSLGYSREEMLALSLNDFAGNLASEEDWRSDEKSLLRRDLPGRIGAIAAGVHLAEHRRKNGTTFPVEVHVGAVDHGGRRLMLASARDVTEHRRAAEAIREAEKKYRTLSESIPLVTYIDELDDVSTCAYISPRFEDLVGVTPEERVANPDLWVGLLHPEDRERVLAENGRTNVTGDPFRMEYRMIHRDGRVVWVRDESVILKDESGRLSVRQGFLLDITERKEAEEKLAHQAFHDSLTGLPNRALFADRLGHAIARLAGRPDGALAVLFLDLDDFKTVNDSLGHTAGDKLLVEVARRISSCTRQGDTVARLGGDEFAILLEEIPCGDDPAAGVEGRVAERLMEVLEEPCVLEGKEILIRPSIGIALGTGPEGSEELLRNADVAMYTAKGRGKGRYEFYDPEMHAAVLERLDLRADLRRAVEGKEFVVHYQPIISLAGEDAPGAVREVEALARWQHPEKGLIPPGKFIPLAEETGIIVEIGLQILEEACRRVRVWQEELSESLTLSANLSARQFRQPNLVEQIKGVLEETGLAPECLKLEVTESVAMENVDAALVTLRRLKDLGIRVAIDDFGTGYSSLSYLRRFPVDNLKIDRSFVGRLEEDPESAAIVATTVSLARTLGLEVTAEGVETAGQLASLRELGCDLAQGYYFSRPLPAGPISELLGAPLAGSGERRGV